MGERSGTVANEAPHGRAEKHKVCVGKIDAQNHGRNLDMKGNALMNLCLAAMTMAVFVPGLAGAETNLPEINGTMGTTTPAMAEQALKQKQKGTMGAAGGTVSGAKLNSLSFQSTNTVKGNLTAQGKSKVNIGGVDIGKGDNAGTTGGVGDNIIPPTTVSPITSTPVKSQVLTSTDTTSATQPTSTCSYTTTTLSQNLGQINNLQAISDQLSKQMGQTSDEVARKSIEIQQGIITQNLAELNQSNEIIRQCLVGFNVNAQLPRTEGITTKDFSALATTISNLTNDEDIKAYAMAKDMLKAWSNGLNPYDTAAPAPKEEAVAPTKETPATTPAATTVKTGDDYPENLKNSSQDSKVDPWNFYSRECTSFVAWKLNDNGIKFTNNTYYKGKLYQFGNASNWLKNASALESAEKKNGDPVTVTVTKTPSVGDVVCFVAAPKGEKYGPYYYDESTKPPTQHAAGSNGHVGYITEVGDGYIIIENYNQSGTGVYSTEKISTTSAAIDGYIHFVNNPSN